jgi:hypothetical protein
MSIERKAWRDLYYFFQDRFSSEYVSILYLTPIKATELINGFFKADHQVADVEAVLAKYFFFRNKRFIIPDFEYPRLLHEIHNPELPADLLPPNYKKQTI